ncbi:uncharacterized protein LOC125531795 isoform X2 [Triticum urartu]|nr:uncharacterized protein LOC125531795 isoform X2 [Triticum urartu]
MFTVKARISQLLSVYCQSKNDNIVMINCCPFTVKARISFLDNLVEKGRHAEIFVGGLLIDLEGRIVGMNFIDENKNPFLPVQIVGRCLKHFRKFGTLLSCIWDDCLKDLVLVSYPTR